MNNKWDTEVQWTQFFGGVVWGMIYHNRFCTTIKCDQWIKSSWAGACLHSKAIALYHVDMNGDETGEGEFGSSASVVSGSLAAGLFVFSLHLCFCFGLKWYKVGVGYVYTDNGMIINFFWDISMCWCYHTPREDILMQQLLLPFPNSWSNTLPETTWPSYQ